MPFGATRAACFRRGFGRATDDNGRVGLAEHGTPEEEGSEQTGARRPMQPPLAPPAFWLTGLILVLAGFMFGWDKVRAGSSSSGSASELDVGILLICASLSAVAATVWWQWKTPVRRR